jgi:hypothetical protein
VTRNAARNIATHAATDRRAATCVDSGMLKRFAAALLAVALLAPAATAGFAAPPSGAGPVSPESLVGKARVLTRAQVRAALAARRTHNLAAFHAYRTGGVYPHNYERNGPMNVWLDRDGHLCAAATMIDKDGQHELVMETGKTDNHVRLADVTDGPLLDWMLTSGFTIAEIDRIQAPMVMPNPRELEPPVDWRVAEDVRLAREYRATETWLNRHQKASLDAATDLLLESYPALAAALVYPTDTQPAT